MATVNMKVEIQGAKQLARKFRNSPNIIAKELHKGLKRSAIIFQRRARKEAPVDTGFLRNNIIYHQPREYSIIIESRAIYSTAVHYGHRTTPAQPYFERAIRKTGRQIDSELKKSTDRALKRLASK